MFKWNRLHDAPYRAKSKLLSYDEKDFHVSAWIEDSNDQICARVTALFREGKGVNLKEIINDCDFSETTPEMMELFDSFVE